MKADRYKNDINVNSQEEYVERIITLQQHNDYY